MQQSQSKKQIPLKSTTIKNDQWDISFPDQTPLFWPILPVYQQLEKAPTIWPTLIEYNHLISGCIKNNNNKNILFVEQGDQCLSFEEEYEPKIFLAGEVQTRLNNWHDFFQVMVWKTFPKTKALLNQIHYEAAVDRNKTGEKQRSKKENFVTLFDECGSLIISSNENILTLVKEFEWDNFFIQNKTEFGKTIDCVVFGHAMYEKALTPYIGMTSHCLLIQVEARYFTLSTHEKTEYLDKAIVSHICEITELNTKNLTPLPILGIPNWYDDQSSVFYKNKTYFRTGRNKKT